MARYDLLAKAALEPIADGMRIGLFGGSFNPAHLGHVHLAETARKRLHLQKVLWLVSPGNPLKDKKMRDNYSKRVQSAAQLTASLQHHEVCESEYFLQTRFSLDTVNGFLERWPKVHFVWLIGADNLALFHHWRHWDELAKRIPMAVISREQNLVKAGLSPFANRFAKARMPEHAARGLVGAQAPAWSLLHAPFSSYSSTALRKK